jgi:hypothetical protein
MNPSGILLKKDLKIVSHSKFEASVEADHGFIQYEDTLIKILVTSFATKKPNTVHF